MINFFQGLKYHGMLWDSLNEQIFLIDEILKLKMLLYIKSFLFKLQRLIKMIYLIVFQRSNFCGCCIYSYIKQLQNTTNINLSCQKFINQHLIKWALQKYIESNR
ncbi:unnamed protein product [Paramecium sonneborni]|uniref:Uncharacterized protein n=1 Tax=Paramecium sonneborni TaxID=65129 RepID=A0A8S1LF32_9CILI|nr:unnamed protein product [Paramecium sonneborni]